MAKDPAVLIYFDRWIASTNGLNAQFRAWYFDLLMYNYDKGSIPDDLDQIAGICRVLPSEYHLFNQMVNQVLKQKFNQNSDGSWYNEVTGEILRKREAFVEKRTKSSNIGVVVKAARRLKRCSEEHLAKLKNYLYGLPAEEVERYKDNQMLNQLLNHLVNLYRDVDEDKDINTGKEGGTGEETPVAGEDKFFIVRAFDDIWRDTMTDYLPDESKDFPALRSIALALCKKHRLSDDKPSRDYYQPVLDEWAKMVSHIAGDKLFSKWNLKQVAEYIQSIGQSMAAAPRIATAQPSKIAKAVDASQSAKDFLIKQYEDANGNYSPPGGG